MLVHENTSTESNVMWVIDNLLIEITILTFNEVIHGNIFTPQRQTLAKY